MIDDLLDMNPIVKKKKEKDTFAGHKDFKKAIMDIIKELESENNLTFRKDEVFERSDHLKIPRDEAETAFDELVQSGYLQMRDGSDDLYERSNIQDYSPAFEEMPDW